jgi:predicted Zn-ribbon and HTH transcriptional regulator
MVLFEEHTFSPRAIRQHSVAPPGPTLGQTIQSIQAAVFISFNNSLSIATPFLDHKIATLTVIEPWVEQIIALADYIELDGSFHAAHPYAYTVPQAIYNNDAYPLGFCICPSESSAMFSLFYSKLKTVVPPDTYEHLCSLPVLSDEGTGIKKFCCDLRIRQFYCFRHLINKFGAAGIIGALVRKMLFISKKHDFDEELEVNLAIAASYFRGNPKKLRLFEELFLVTFEPNDDTKKETWTIHSPGYDEQALWSRMELHVGTCSNHAERFHRTLKAGVDISAPLEAKVLNIQENAIGRVKRLSEEGGSRLMLQESMRQTARFYRDNSTKFPQIKYSEECPDCKRNKVLEARFRYRVPCIHQQEDYVKSGLGFKKIPGNIPVSFAYKTRAPVLELEQITTWNFATHEKAQPKLTFSLILEPADECILVDVIPNDEIRKLAKDVQHIWGEETLPHLSRVLQLFWSHFEIGRISIPLPGDSPKQMWKDFVVMVWTGAGRRSMAQLGYSVDAIPDLRKQKTKP